MARVSLRDVRKSVGATEIIKGIDLDIADGEFFAIVGPPGAGKSALLRLIAGLETMSAGTLTIDDVDVTPWPPADRGIAMVFPSDALYPRMTVRENIAFGRKATPEAVTEAARVTGLDTDLDRRPSLLSADQRRRIAIARAIARAPKLFLFHEPLANLDPAARLRMRVELARLQRTLAATTIYATSDPAEAMTMADRIAVLRDGRIEQLGSPLDLYARPRNLFVAQFIGSPPINVVAARIATTMGGAARVELPGGVTLRVPLHGDTLPPGPVALGIRPEHVSLGLEGGGVPGRVMLVERLGFETILHVAVANGATMVARAGGHAPVLIGEAVTLTLDPRGCHLFEPAGPALIHAFG